MKIRTKLLIAFVACGVLPVLIAGLISLRVSNKSLSEIEGFALAGLEQTATNQLLALRDVIADPSPECLYRLRARPEHGFRDGQHFADRGFC